MEIAHCTPALGQVAELAKQLAEAQNTRAGLDKQLSALCRQMGDGQPSIGGESRSCVSEHMTFEQALAAHLADTGDSMMVSSVMVSSSSCSSMSLDLSTA
jgi:hypothetical protein